MKNSKGVTLASLTIYVIVSLVILAILAFINVNFVQEVKVLTSKVELSNETTKLYSFLISDIKSSESVKEYSDVELLFSNNSHYEIRKRLKDGTNNQYEYAVYRNSALICEKFDNMVFDYDYEKNVVYATFKLENEDYKFEATQSYKVGRGY